MSGEEQKEPPTATTGVEKQASRSIASLPVLRKVKALVTMQRAESYLRENIMLGSYVGMFTESALAGGKAQELLAEALAYLTGAKDDELRKWINSESAAIAVTRTEYYVAVPPEEKP